MFISFEGGEGSGKSTQIRRLAAFFEEKGRESIITREPGGSVGGEEIRKLLVTGDANRWDGMTELLLLYAARNDHVEKIIKPSLNEGKIVLCDRFSDSTMAYQGYGHGLGIERVNEVHNATLRGFAPDLTLLLDLPVEIGLKRAIERADNETRYENMDIEFHTKMRNGYLEIAKNNPNRVAIIDAQGDIDTVFDRIITKITQDLSNNGEF